jgi:hypothetical protein
LIRTSGALCALLFLGACAYGPPAATIGGTVDSMPLRVGKTSALRAKTDFVVARTQSEWDAAWQLPVTDQHGRRSAPLSIAPAVQFSDRMVLGVVFPAGPDSCTNLEIVEVTQGAKGLTVHYRARRPEGQAVCLTAFFAPYVFVTVPQDRREVTFVETAAQ